MPSVTVVVPVLDMADTIGPCLQALVGQSVPEADREIIVVDNGSRDGTRDVAARFPVTVLEEPTQGAPNARNTGVRAAQAPLIAFTDADCVPSRHWLRSIVSAAAQPGVEVVAGPLAVLDPSQSLIARYSATIGQYDSERTLQHPKYPYAPTANLAIRRNVLDDVGPFNPTFPTFDAAELFWRLARRGPVRFAFEPRAIVFYRTRPSLAGFVRQNYGYGQGVGRYCRVLGRDDAPSTRGLVASSLRRFGMVGSLARSGGSVGASAGLVGLHLIRESAVAAGTLIARMGPRR